MFVGREKELIDILNQINSSKKTSILIYGKRRVGKTTLIKESLKKYKDLSILHTCIQSSYQSNLDALAKSICLSLNLPIMQFNNIADIFEFLKKQNKEIVLIIDEYPYLKNSLSNNEVDSYMQQVIDNLPHNIKLILCGSYISSLKELLYEDNPLFGRFSLIIHLENLNYLESSQLFLKQSKDWFLEEYLIFGGSPYVLNYIENNKKLKENIIELLLKDRGILRVYVENILLKEIQKTFDIKILEIIGNGKKKYAEIENKTHYSSSGLLSKQLNHLIDMDIIDKISPINKRNDKKKQFYILKDNILRFYFTFIFGYDAIINNIGEESYYEQYINPKLNSYLSYRFEDIAKQYFSIKSKEGKIKNIQDIGIYWYDDKDNKTKGEFDCVLKINNRYSIYECKYYKKPMKLIECNDEEKQIRKIKEVQINKLGFICTSGFSFKSNDHDLITLNDLFN